MSIIGEMYEEQIYQQRQDRRKKMNEFLAYLNMKIGSKEKTYTTVVEAIEEFKKIFEDELK